MTGPKFISFSKLTASGNDFVFVERRELSGFLKTAELAKKICDRHFGIGADGFVIIGPADAHQSFDYQWDFFNADGGRAEMCGNASRCAARFLQSEGITKNPLTLSTDSGIVHLAFFSDGRVEVKMPPARIINPKLSIALGEHLALPLIQMNTGVPHAVKENDDWDPDYIDEMGAFILGATHSNATFFEVTGPSQVHAATYERGVNAVTLSCGTGAVAAAIAAQLKGHKSPIQVEMPGGCVEIALNQELTNIYLRGDARLLCDGRFFLEELI